MIEEEDEDDDEDGYGNGDEEDEEVKWGGEEDWLGGEGR